MSAVPVVWCSDPNSSEKKQPFALQGIQLQGNITEKHVLAMKELINAASEGRLLLPTDGAIVLLDCGLSIGSMVIEGKAGKEVAAAAAAASSTNSTAGTGGGSDNDDDAVGNHKSILPYRPAAANNCEPSPVDGRDCNNHNSSSSSDESDRIATSDRQWRLDAAEKLRVMLEQQLDGGDIDPDQPNATVSQRAEEEEDRGSTRGGSNGGEEKNLDDRLGEREIDFPIEQNANQTRSNELQEEEEEEEEGNEEAGAVERIGSSLGGAGPELLYEFLCCAKCMNDPSSSCSNMPSHRTRSLTALNNSSKLLSRVLNGRAKARLYCDPVYSISNLYFKRFINYKITKSRRPVIRKSSSRSDRSSGGGGDVAGGYSTAPDGGGGSVKKKHYADGSPVYATVNKKLKLKSRLDALRRSGHMMEGSSGGRRLRVHNGDASRLPGRKLDKRALVPEAANALPEIFITGTSGSPTKPLGGSSSRKTSFDSTCTVSSMDSGFIDQQQRQQLKQQLQQLQQLKVCPGGGEEQSPAGVGASEREEEDDGNDRLNDLSRVQIKECLVTQSRNRRKSYEEFKSLFRQEVAPGADVAGHAGRANNTAGLPLPSVDEKESVKARRKSYEEFKALVKICDTSFSSLKTTAEEQEPEKEQKEEEDTRTRRSATLPASPTTNSVGNLFKMKRKNSRRLSLKKPSPVGGGTGGGDIQRSESGREVVRGSTIYDILRSDRKASVPSPLIKDLGQLALTRTADEIYRKNYKIYDKLISYGSKAYKRYDKYMTYGTIYEILHRKSDAAEDVFLRKRALSEKYAKRKVGTASSHYGSVKLGTIYDILQGKHQQLQIDASSRKKSAPGPDETPPATLSTIYDIIHSKKAADPSSPKDKTSKNRFLVKKITEEELHLSNENNRNELNLTSGTVSTKGVVDASSVSKPSEAPADSGPPSPDYTTPKSVGQARKPARTRRFSNILSYSSHSTSPKASTAVAANMAPATIEEPRLDSPRLKQIAASDEDLYKSATAKLRAAQQQVQRHQLSVDELYARIGKLRKSATVSSALCTKIDEVAGEGGEMSTDHVKVLEPLQPTRARHHLNVPERRDLGPADEIQPGAIFKSNSLDMLAPKKLSRTARWSKHMHDAANGLSGPIRKLSPLIMPMKKGGGTGDQKKSTRRLSEFTRGEFLNEKP
uniref:Uncharacterized protein n=1 Tax=Anopheles culicifacies TaxID=139723 RepID=A0A182M583_9DIPT